MDTLPPELLQYLYSFLDVKDRRSLRNTCTTLYVNDIRRVVRASGHFTTPNTWSGVRSLTLTGYIKTIDIACPNLISLDLSNTDVSGITPLQHCTMLHTLNLTSTNVTDITSLQYCIKLHTLDLENTKVKDIAPLRSIALCFTLSTYGTPM